MTHVYPIHVLRPQVLKENLEDSFEQLLWQNLRNLDGEYILNKILVMFEQIGMSWYGICIFRVLILNKLDVESIYRKCRNIATT